MFSHIGWNTLEQAYVLANMTLSISIPEIVSLYNTPKISENFAKGYPVFSKNLETNIFIIK